MECKFAAVDSYELQNQHYKICQEFIHCAKEECGTEHEIKIAFRSETFMKLFKYLVMHH